MKRNISIQFKAALLLIVFSLNSVIGFSCCMEMGINSDSKNEANEAAKLIHECCKKQERKEGNHHDRAKGSKGCCCNDILKFSQSDKSVPQSVKAIEPGFFTSLISSVYNVKILIPSQQNVSIKYFVRSYHPPIPDIRIAIQSFQV